MLDEYRISSLSEFADQVRACRFALRSRRIRKSAAARRDLIAQISAAWMNLALDAEDHACADRIMRELVEEISPTLLPMDFENL